MSHVERETSGAPVIHQRPVQRPVMAVDWERIAEDLKDAGPPTDDDVSRALDGAPLTSGKSIVRHMAHLEADGLLDSGEMFSTLLGVLDESGENAMMAEMWRRYGQPNVGTN